MANNWFSHVGVADVLAKVPNTPHKVTYLSPTRKAIALRIDSMRVQISKNKITFSIGGYNRLFLPLRSRVVVVGGQMARKPNYYGPGDTSVRVLALVCDCLSTEALRVAICQVPQTLEATVSAMLATLDMASATPRILLLQPLPSQYNKRRP